MKILRERRQDFLFQNEFALIIIGLMFSEGGCLNLSCWPRTYFYERSCFNCQLFCLALGFSFMPEKQDADYFFCLSCKLFGARPESPVNTALGRRGC